MVEPQVLIAGAGPAGLAAAVQLQRYGVPYVLIEKGEPAGLLRNANRVENYLGFPGGIPGPALVELLQRHAAQTGVEVVPAEIEHLSWVENGFRAETSAGVFTAPRALLATGTRARRLPEPSMPVDVQAHTAYELRDLGECSGQRIAILGAGDLAFDYALTLSRRNQVWVLNRGIDRSCLPLLWERAQQRTSLHYFENAGLSGIRLAEGGALELALGLPPDLRSLTVDALLVAIGREPQISFVDPALLRAANELEQQGWLYWAGDVHNGIYRQAAIAAGEGVRAAMRIWQHIYRRTE